ncbi:MAG: energy transducer TonB [Candidatus Methylomirabilales bacterium]
MAATQHGIDLGGGTGGGAREGTGPSHHTGEVASLGSGAESGRGQGGGIGVRNGSADGGSADLIQALLARIERAKRYSPEARRLGVEGTVEVQFTIDVQGRAKEVRVIRSSGSALLDAASVETVKRAEPLPPVGGVIRVPIAYRLRDRW